MDIEWRIYYSDGGTFSSLDGEPQDAHGYGVICIVQFDSEVNRMIMHGWDFFYWVEDEGQWWGSDLQGVLDRLCHRLPCEALCQGRNVSNKVFAEIMGKADKDPDFPPRGKTVIERGAITARRREDAA